jgi:peptide-methionine (S)-S-oxide reductase
MMRRLLLLAFVMAAPTSLTAAEPAATAGTETLTLGGGCFWCVEAVYEELRGVSAAVSGYSGGDVKSPTYRAVTGGTTGHAEVVEITFDPRVVTRDQVLEVFFTVHDPTTRDRQGADVGPQYRSIAFYRDPAQKAAIESAIAKAANGYPDPVVTQVVPFEAFWPAEDYHQQYFELNGEEPYCNLVIAPKIAKFRKKYGAWLKSNAPG